MPQPLNPPNAEPTGKPSKLLTQLAEAAMGIFCYLAQTTEHVQHRRRGRALSTNAARHNRFV
jgi:hypothetical protein